MAANGVHAVEVAGQHERRPDRRDLAGVEGRHVVAGDRGHGVAGAGRRSARALLGSKNVAISSMAPRWAATDRSCSISASRCLTCRATSAAGNAGSVRVWRSRSNAYSRCRLATSTSTLIPASDAPAPSATPFRSSSSANSLDVWFAVPSSRVRAMIVAMPSCRAARGTAGAAATGVPSGRTGPARRRRRPRARWRGCGARPPGTCRAPAGSTAGRGRSTTGVLMPPPPPPRRGRTRRLASGAAGMRRPRP